MDAKVLARYKINKRILRKNCLKKKESDRKEEKQERKEGREGGRERKDRDRKRKGKENHPKSLAHRTSPISNYVKVFF